MKHPFEEILPGKDLVPEKDAAAVLRTRREVAGLVLAFPTFMIVGCSVADTKDKGATGTGTSTSTGMTTAAAQAEGGGGLTTASAPAEGGGPAPATDDTFATSLNSNEEGGTAQVVTQAVAEAGGDAELPVSSATVAEEGAANFITTFDLSEGGCASVAPDPGPSGTTDRAGEEGGTSATTAATSAEGGGGMTTAAAPAEGGGPTNLTDPGAGMTTAAIPAEGGGATTAAGEGGTATATSTITVTATAAGTSTDTGSCPAAGSAPSPADLGSLGADFTSQAQGEEGGSDHAIATSQATGEEGGADNEVTSVTSGEEGGSSYLNSPGPEGWIAISNGFTAANQSLAQQKLSVDLLAVRYKGDDSNGKVYLVLYTLTVNGASHYLRNAIVWPDDSTVTDFTAAVQDGLIKRFGS